MLVSSENQLPTHTWDLFSGGSDLCGLPLLLILNALKA